MIARLANYAVQQNHIISIVTLDDEPSFYSLDSHVTHIPLGVARSSRNVLDAVVHNIVSLKAVRGAFSQLQPDIVVCFGHRNMLQAALVRRGMHYKIIGSERANPGAYPDGFWARNRVRISKRCDGFLFQTEGARQFYPEDLRKKSMIMPNCIDLKDFAGYTIADHERRDLCAVGRMDANKCFDDLLRAFAIVHQKHPEVRLDLFGDGPLCSDLERSARELALEDAVIFRGKSSHIYEEYAKHKIFAMSSETEGMPNVLMEAMASGCACVSTDCDFGPSELIRDGENGFLVPVHDVETMADRICQLIEDDVLCCCMGDAARSIQQTHSIETIGAQFLSYIESI